MTWLVDADVTEPLIVSQVQASGGTESVIRIAGQLYRLHTFKTDGTFTVTKGGQAEVLVVGAGGRGGPVPASFTANLGAPGGYLASGGGGGGGVVECSVDLIDSSSYTIDVGTTSSADSAIILGTDVVRAKGGGNGGAVTLTASGNAVDDGLDGGSSGGGSFIYNSTNYADETSNSGNAVFGQGNKGANAISTIAGGGGGAAQPARKLAESLDPNGGNGVMSAITGSIRYYGGGGATIGNGILGIGGIGGGGSPAGTLYEGIVYFFTGVPNTGGGGPGCSGRQISVGLVGYSANNISTGGSGIVIIRYPIEG